MRRPVRWRFVLRHLLIAVSALAFAVPAAAQPRHVDAELAHDLPHPGEIEEMGERLGDVTDALLDIEVGPLVRALDPYGDHRGRHTVGDLASDDPYARDRVRDDIDRATVGVSVAVEQIAILAPVLAAVIDNAERRMDEALRERPQRRYRR
jgi:hypothetical protein